MRPYLLNMVAVCAALLLTSSEVRADYTTASCLITGLTQWSDQETLVVTDTVIPSTVCGGTCSATTGVYLKTVTGKPSYGSLAPYVMAAFLYNKPVVFTVSGCVACLPIITTVAVSY